MIVPVYNEGPNIEQTLYGLKECLPTPHEVIVVYDFDEDDTLPVLRRLIGEIGDLRVVKNRIARGPSGALRTGFAEARAPRVLVVMADLCDDLTQIPHLLSLVPEQADVVCPSRYCTGGRQLIDPSLKTWAPRTAGILLRYLAGVPTYDPTNSFKVYSTDLLKRLHLSSTVSFSVTLEIVAKAHCLGCRIVEVPTVWRDRHQGKTNFHLGAALVAYLPWFGVALLRGRFLRLPSAWLRALFSTTRAGASSGERTVRHL